MSSSPRAAAQTDPLRNPLVGNLPAMRSIVPTSAAIGAAILIGSACSGSEDLRPQLESEIPTTTTEPFVYYSEEGDGPKYIDMYFEAERRWPDLTPDQWAAAATLMIDGGSWDEVTVFMVPTTTTGS